MKTHHNRPMKYVLAFLLVGLGPRSSTCQTSAPSAKTVVLHVTVTTDGGGGYASGVNKDSFAISTDELAAQITAFQSSEVPSSICIVLDTTEGLSLLKSPKGNIVLSALTNGLAEFKSFVQGTEFSIVGFAERPQLILDWTEDLNAVGAAIGSIKLKNRQTALYDGCLVGLEKLTQAKTRKRVLLIISGSSDNRSQHKFSELRRLVRENDVLVYTVGIRDSDFPYNWDVRWQSELAELGTISGGLFRSAGNAGSVLFQFANLSLELKHQYMIGVATNSAFDGKYHRLQLKLKPEGNNQQQLKGLRVRTREGYVAVAK